MTLDYLLDAMPGRHPARPGRIGGLLGRVVRAAMAGLALMLAAGMAAAAAAAPSVALHYGARPPWAELAAFDWVVLEPGHHGDVSARARAMPRTRLFAYVSVGEINRQHPRHDEVPAAWRLATNRAWNSTVIDPRVPEWPAWFVEHVARPQWARGYRGFFLDTLDAYHQVARTPEDRAAHEAGLVRVVRALKAAFPEAKLILNRGFEILPEVAGDVDMVAAESLYRGWNPTTLRYRTVSAEDRDWLLGQFETVRTRHRLPLLAIDYVPPEQRALARETARRIRAHGIVPWVTTPELDTLGVGAVEVLPRRVLVLHDGPVGKDYSELHIASALRFHALPLDHLGLVPVLLNPDEQPLPSLREAGPLAGIVTTFANDRPRPATAALLRAAIAQGVKVVSLGWPGLGSASVLRETLEMNRRTGVALSAPVTVSRRDPMIGFEATPVPGTLDFVPLQAPAGSEVLLQMRDAAGTTMDAVAWTPWGGYAWSGYSVMRLPAGEDEYRWVIDPVAFLRRALALPPMPVPDTTTETGRRMLMVHIDGDGFPNRADLPGAPLASEVLLRDVLARYRVPTAMSVIEGETAPHGLYPRLAAQMEEHARRMFAMPHVEIATHTFSHPFQWTDVERGAFGKGYALEIPGYRFDAEREIAGSIRYIESRLAPAGKKVTLVHWSGDTNPGESTLAEVARAGVLSVNGGDTTATRAYPSLTRVAPLGLRKGGQYQVFAPNQNENVYTNLFTGPLYGHERVIQTFELTERPYRLKPVNIYYHTYAASRRASLEALHRVYRWALAQPLHPVPMSAWVRKALDHETVVVAREVEPEGQDDGTARFLVRGAADLRQMRVPSEAGVPQMAASQGVAGHVAAGPERYVHLGADEARIVLAPRPDDASFLVDANARVEAMERGPSSTRLTLHAHVPLRLTVRHPPGCAISLDGRRLAPVRSADGLHHYASERDGTETLTIGCP